MDGSRDGQTPGVYRWYQTQQNLEAVREGGERRHWG